MIIEMMAYTTAISFLMGSAALAIERAIALASWPRRWLWAAAMAISLAGPAGIALSTHSRPSTPVSAARSLGTLPPVHGRAAPLMVMAAPPKPMHLARDVRIPARLEASARWMWLGSSLCLVGSYLLGALRLRHLRRRWPSRALGGYHVFVTDEIGPAVVGLLRPAIVLPRWLLTEPASIRDTALTHESEHIAARDPGLLLAALLLLAVTPWNLPLWWQLRRLRLAIEIDCDRRVLDTGTDGHHYANTLLRVNQQASGLPIGSIAIVGRVPQIERRVRAMLAERPRYKRLWIATWAAIAVPLLAAAAELSPPASAPKLPPAHQLEVGITDFDVNGAATSATMVHHPGVLVTEVLRGGPADLAGLMRGDVILRYGDTPLSGMKDLMTAVAHTPVGAQRIPLLIRRDSRELNLVVEFAAAQMPQPRSGPRVVDTSDWDTLRDANLPIQTPELGEELVQMSGLNDVQQMMKRLSKQPPPTPNTAVVAPITPPSTQMRAGAEPNVRRLQEIIAQYGWPTISMVGVRGAHAAAYIAISAADNTDLKPTVLTLMEPLVHRGEVPAADYAMLYDQVHTPQRYGTQVACENGEVEPSKPIEDPGHLDERRAALGLPNRPKLCVLAGGRSTL